MKPRSLLSVLAVGVGLMNGATVHAQSWVTFVNETSSRIQAAAALSTSDPEEKDFAYADFDQDGDIDLVCVRKQPFSTAGRRENVLFMNEGLAEGHAVNGVLVDRTQLYASLADDGGQGMRDMTNDRDVTVADVNGDGWIDIITATTYGQAFSKTISHPRIYMNLGKIRGVWQGFRYEQARIPTLPAAPNFCGVGAGDVTGDGAPDLYFVDYEGNGGSPFDDRLLVNNGTGTFSDQTALRLNSAWSDSGFGTTANIADMNGDGKNDIIKSENGPIKIIYNGATTGIFGSMQTVYTGAGYFSSVGDLNGDGKMDIVVSDDSQDRYFVNTSAPGPGQATFNGVILPNSGGIGNSSRIVDLDNDGKMDVVIADVDVDISGCSRRTHIYQNTGTGSNVVLNEPSTGAGCTTTINPPATCIVAGIPATSLMGTHDVAVFDLNGDGWKDLILGRCSGIEIWMNVPPAIECPADTNGSQGVDIDDLVSVITSWGQTGAPGTIAADVNNDGVVNIDDMVMVITNWGPCG